MEDLKKLADNKANPKKEKLSLGFGFFSTAEDEDDWNWLPYDGLEGIKI